MTPNAGRYVAGATAGLAIALSLTACKGAGQDKASGDGKPAGGGVQLTAAQSAVAKMSSQTGSLRSFRGTMSFSSDEDFERSMKGKLVYRAKPMAMRLDFPSVDIRGRKVPGAVTEIVAGNRLYMKAPGFDTRTGKPWVSITLSELSAFSGVDHGSMTQTDPSLTAKMLTASKDVRLLGKETVGGVSTTHYQGTYALRDGLAKLSSQQRAQAEQAFGKAGFDTMDFDVWVDGQQRPRKVTMASPTGAKLAMKMTMTYTAFNVPVAIKAPPKSQVADGSGLLSGGGANVPG